MKESSLLKKERKKNLLFFKNFIIHKNIEYYTFKILKSQFKIKI